MVDQVGSRLPVRQLLSQERVEHGAGRIKCLQFILDIQGIKHIGRVVHRQMGTVGIVRCLALYAGRDDSG